MFTYQFKQTLYLSIVSILMVCFLISCNGSFNETPVDSIGTAVASTLTAQPTLTTLPTATLVLSSTPNLPPTPTASNTPTPGPSPTATFPPLPSGDPRTGLNLSSPDYVDNFNLSTTWGGPYNEAAANLIKDGYLEAIDYLADGYAWWSTTLPEGRDIYVETTAEFFICSGKDSAGLGLRISGQPFDRGYTVEVSCDGHYRVRKFSPSAVSSLIEWTFSQEIIQGPNASNVIGFVARGNELHISINGSIVDSTEDFSYSSGTFALFANALETPGMTVHFDEFKLWYF